MVLSAGLTSKLEQVDSWPDLALRAIAHLACLPTVNILYFIGLGVLIPWSSFGGPGLEWWRLVALSAWVLCLRRLPVVLALQHAIPAIQSTREAVFVGWFGPMGVGALFYALLCTVTLEVEAAPLMPVVVWLVLSSIVVAAVVVVVVLLLENPLFDQYVLQHFVWWGQISG